MTTKPGTAVVPWGSGNPPGSTRDTPDEELRDREDRWYEAWRLDRLGLGSREIGRRLGVSRTAAQKYIKRWDDMIAGSRDLVEERNHQLAVLDRLEQKLWREAETHEVTWAAATGPLRAVMADKRELLGISSPVADTATAGASERPQSVERALSVVRDLRGDSRKTG